MLSFQDFFTACAGKWTTERIYHYVQEGQVERSYTEFRVTTIAPNQKQQ
ncbi:MAG TPA: phycobiliprotein lyase, partial [Cyanobacteria bacterium UBA11049]|nr:phycobiliprotein lyase [Cyanobacteria bacterium UBA11049]